MINKFLDAIYPNTLYCICCGKIIDESRTYKLCNDCMKSIKWNVGRACKCCGRRLSKNNPRDICYNCVENKHVFNTGFSCTEYGTHERYIVMRYKYGNLMHIGEIIGEIMADCFVSVVKNNHDKFCCNYDLIVPVPLSYKRERERGYNQSNIIASNFALHANLNPKNIKKRKYFSDKLIEPVLKIRDTIPMKGLSPKERRVVISGCYSINYEYRDKIKGSNCIIIDDIYTTGATIDEIASILYDAGAKKVDYFTFASGADVIQS